MPHIIIKSRTPANIHGKPAFEEAGDGPFIIDFREQKKGIPASFLLACFAIFCSFFFTAVVAIVLLTETTARQIKNISAPPALNSVEDVPAAFSLEPLPSRALIIGRDFQQNKVTRKPSAPVGAMNERELVPLLEKLPLYGAVPSDVRTRRGLAIDVESIAPPSPQVYVAAADRAYAEGDMAGAIKAASAALAITPQDASLRQNLIALLLEKAGMHEEQDEWVEAAVTYDKALKAIKGQAALKASITARRDYVKELAGK